MNDRYLHRHRFRFLRRTTRDHYLFLCEDCDRHGMSGFRKVRVEWFWQGL